MCFFGLDGLRLVPQRGPPRSRPGIITTPREGAQALLIPTHERPALALLRAFMSPTIKVTSGNKYFEFQVLIEAAVCVGDVRDWPLAANTATWPKKVL